MKTLLNYIDGTFQPAATGDTFADINPATNQIIANVAKSGEQDVERAVSAAQRAQHGAWRQTSTAERADLCDAIADHLEANLEALAQMESADTGKPITTARTIDIPRAVANFRFFAGAVRHGAQACHPMADALNYTNRKPLGVVALITPWNLPLYLLSWKVAPALATGNAIVAKPSEFTPQTASALAEAFHAVGAPAGVFNLLHGFGADAGAPLVAHHGVNGVSFTGGTTTGAAIARTASASFKKLSLELGGKNATVVFDDADLDQAIPGAVRAAFTNNGQVCLCGSRVLVQRGIYDAFVERFAAAVDDMVVGDPSDPHTQVGPLINPAQQEKIRSYLQLAGEEGGRQIAGGSPSGLAEGLHADAFFRPTVFADLAPECRTSQEEIFGPIATVHVFDDEAEALSIANGVRYGLAASVWTRDLQRAHAFATALDVGMVWINTWLKRDLRVPFGGTKDSGVGREGGAYSLAFYTEDQNICVQLAES